MRVMISLLLLIYAIPSVAAPQSTSPPIKSTSPARPGIAIKLLQGTTGHSVSLIVAFDYLTKPEQRPRFEGVRFYTYQVPLGTVPYRIGYVADATHSQAPVLAVILNGKKYIYTQASMDRVENGSITVERIATPNKYRVRGVYSYFDQLFVVDTEIHLGGEIFLFEKPAETGSPQ